MTRVFAWQDKATRRRMFDGERWFDVDPGEVVVMAIGRDINPTKFLTAIGVDVEPEEIK